MNLRATLLLVFFAMCGCRSDITFDQAYNNCLNRIHKKPYSVDLIDAGKTITSKDNLLGGPLADSLGKLLEEKRGSWKKSKRTSYAPRLLFTTDGLSLNVRDDIAVLNLQITDKEWAQYVSTSSAGQLTQLIDLLKRLP